MNIGVLIEDFVPAKHQDGVLSCYNAELEHSISQTPQFQVYKVISRDYVDSIKRDDQRFPIHVATLRSVVVGWAMMEYGDFCFVTEVSILPILSNAAMDHVFEKLLDSCIAHAKERGFQEIEFTAFEFSRRLEKLTSLGWNAVEHHASFKRQHIPWMTYSLQLPSAH
jgi:hypothetical protein